MSLPDRTPARRHHESPVRAGISREAGGRDAEVTAPECPDLHAGAQRACSHAYADLGASRQGAGQDPWHPTQRKSNMPPSAFHGTAASHTSSRTMYERLAQFRPCRRRIQRRTPGRPSLSKGSLVYAVGRVAVRAAACGSAVARILWRRESRWKCRSPPRAPLHGTRRGICREELVRSPLCTPSGADRGDWI